MKIKRFDLSVEGIKNLLGSGRHDREVIENAIPNDAELVRVNTNQNESTPSKISLFFKSESYPDVPEGTVLPSETITFREYYKEDNGNEQVVVASGYFNPLHVGHIRYLKEAKELGDKLIVILNNDEQVKLKGSTPFMTVEERKEILESLGCVDEVVVSIDEDRTVCKTLELVNPTIFAKGGDSEYSNIPEVEVCKKNGIIVFLDVGGGKVQSSSWLLNKKEANHD